MQAVEDVLNGLSILVPVHHADGNWRVVMAQKGIRISTDEFNPDVLILGEHECDLIENCVSNHCLWVEMKKYQMKSFQPGERTFTKVPTETSLADIEYSYGWKTIILEEKIFFDDEQDHCEATNTSEGQSWICDIWEMEIEIPYEVTSAPCNQVFESDVICEGKNTDFSCEKVDCNDIECIVDKCEQQLQEEYPEEDYFCSFIGAVTYSTENGTSYIGYELNETEYEDALKDATKYQMLVDMQNNGIGVDK
jgi:hypothetical protein